MSITRVSRLTAPQLAQGLEELPAAQTKALREQLQQAQRAPGEERFLDGVNTRLANDGLDARSARVGELKRAAALEIAKLERAISKSGVRKAGETVSLATVQKSFGKAMRDLLEALERVHVTGRLAHDGAVPITRSLAGEVGAAYARLGEKAADDAVVVHEMQKLYPTFEQETLEAVHAKFGKAGPRALVPDRAALVAARERAALEEEAAFARQLIEKQGVSTVRDLVQVMRALGSYSEFDEARYLELRKALPDVVPAISRERKPDEYELAADKIRAFIEKHPAATAPIIARHFHMPLQLVIEAAELAGMALSETRTARIMDPFDALCDALVQLALRSRARGAGIEEAAAFLNGNKAFVERFGKTNAQELAAYVGEHLPKLAGKAKAGDAPPPWEGAKAGRYDRAFAEMVAFVYSIHDIDEPAALTALKSFDAKFNKYRLNKLRKEHPDLVMGLRTTDIEERRALAQVIAQIMKERPGITHAEIEDVARERGHSRVSPARINALREEFPDIIEKRIDRVTNAELAEIERKVAEVLEKKPRASVAEVAKAVGARETQVVKPLRRLRKENMEVSQTRYTEVDRALVEKLVREMEPGTTLGDIQQQLMADKTFAKRHAGININTIRDIVAELVPEAQDWKAYNLTIVARVLDEALQSAPPDRSLSRTVDAIRKEHPTFPKYVALLATTTRSMEKHIERMPWMKKYMGPDGRIKLSTVPTADLTKEFAQLMAKAFKDAPDTWSNEQIFAKLLSDPKVKKKHPLIGESQLTGLRTKFPGVIPTRPGGKKEDSAERKAAQSPADAPSRDAQAATNAIRARSTGAANDGRRLDQGQGLADAKRLSKQMQAILKKGGKIKNDEIAKEWGVDNQYLRRLIQRNPTLFTFYKKRYEITEHIARTMGQVISTMPLGTTIDGAAELLEKSGLLPPDMKIQKTLLINAQAKFPALVPNINERNKELFLRIVAREIVTAPKGTTLKQIFDDVTAKTSGEHSHHRNMFVSPEKFLGEHVPAWQRMKDPPSWVKAMMVDGKVARAGLGKPASSFPKSDNTAVERDLAQLAEVPQRLEMLERIIGRKSRNTFAECNVLCIQHLLGSNFRFVEAVNRMGAKKEDIVTVGIPYSTSETVARTMNDGGLETLTPPLNIAAWERQIEDAIFQMIEKAKKNGKKIVVFDDGGLVAKILHEKPWAQEHRGLFRIVEQTTRGITVAKKYDLEVPLINYAQDPAKNLEGDMIGEVVLDRIYKRLDAVGRRKELATSGGGMPVTCVGAGVIGLPTALDMARAGARVRIYDTDPAARARARKAAKEEGLDIEIVDDPVKAFSGAKMIVGCTGHTSIAKEAFEHMADGCMLVSTSSKLVEIDMGLLDDQAGGRRRVIDNDNHPPTCEYELADGRKITVFADGFPVNFDGAVNCVEAEDIQLTHAGMLLAGIQATWKNLDDGLIAFDDTLRKELLDDWKEVKAERERERAEKKKKRD